MHKLAEADLAKAIEIDSALSEAWYRRGVVRVYYLDKKPEGASDLRKYLALEPNGKYGKSVQEILAALGQ